MDATRRSLLTNMHGGVVSDCPHRERLGYTGDGQQALPILCRPEGPSFNYLFDGSYTTLWESYWGDSHNHPMFGRMADVLIRTLLGLPDDLGAAHLTIRPMLPADMTFAKGHTTTADGRLSVEWSKRGDSVLLRIEVPWNRTAELELGGRIYPLSCGKNSVAVPCAALQGN